jgi:3-hydroxy-9,10-secoandrosta-1,3,5(10)-triene-9,17-dione monooxygenase
MARDISAVAAQLQRSLSPGQVLCGRTDEQSRHHGKDATDDRPVVIVLPETPHDVQIAVLAAREHNLPLSVRAGGASAGLPTGDPGLVIDLSRKQRVVVDPEHRTATIQGGATAGGVASTALRQRLSVVTGATAAVGMAGLTLDGGYGPFTGHFGLALDNLLSAEVVLADGRRVTANPIHEPELFWALRGGGKFGVVTSMRVRMHPVERVLAGLIVYPWSQACAVLSRLGDTLDHTPDELTVRTGMLSGRHGEPAVLLAPVWSGEMAQGHQVFEQLRSIGSPSWSQVAATTPAAMLHQFGARPVTRRRLNRRRVVVRDYTPDVIVALVDAGESQSSQYARVFIHPFHGAATRVPGDATAFGIREPHYMIEILAASESGDEATRVQAWADCVSTNLAPHAPAGLYRPVGARLGAVKARFDPDGVFSDIPLPICQITCPPMLHKEAPSMSTSSMSALPTTIRHSAEEVLNRVNELVPVLRARAADTEKLRRMHPDNLRDLTAAGVFRLTVPADVGGYEADDEIVTEVLAQISRGCPSTSWICCIMTSANTLPALLTDDAAHEIYATPDLRMTGTFEATGEATRVEGGYEVTGQWIWNSGGIHSNWIAPVCRTTDEGGPARILAIIPASEVEHQQNWRAAGMRGTATNIVSVKNVFVPASRTILVNDLLPGVFPRRRYSDNAYYNRPWIMLLSVHTGPVLLGMARGAMDVFMEYLPTRGAITYTGWTKAAEAPVLHHQLAKAQFSLETAEMYTDRLCQLLKDTRGGKVSITERVQARAWLGRVATHARACVNQLFEASGASQTLITADLQRYFRDVNVLHQHAAVQPNSSDELYGRVLAGLEPNTELL